jgi:hypothetical protein
MILYIEIFCITCYNYGVNQIFADDRRFNMKKRLAFIALILVFAMLGMTACGLIPTPENPPEQGGENPDPHEHNFVEGKCECGETDPNYKPPHQHSFVDGKCECGVTDPNYEAPHTHFWNAATCTDPRTCECGETLGTALGHKFVDGACTRCQAEDPDYVHPHEHNFVEGKCECGEILDDANNQAQQESTGGIFGWLKAIIDAIMKIFMELFS